MTQPRKPLFGFLWPKPDPAAPVDGAYRQIRKVRMANRGPIRVVTLAVGSVLTVAVLGTALTAALTSPVSVLTFVGAGVAATALVLLLRGWVVGTYANDRAVTVETTWRRRAIAWSDVQRVDVQSGRTPFLGLPIRVAGDRCMLQLTDGTSIATHLYTSSPDLWLRDDAWDMARLRLIHWCERA